MNDVRSLSLAPSLSPLEQVFLVQLSSPPLPRCWQAGAPGVPSSLGGYYHRFPFLSASVRRCEQEKAGRAGREVGRLACRNCCCCCCWRGAAAVDYCCMYRVRPAIRLSVSVNTSAVCSLGTYCREAGCRRVERTV